MTKLSLKIKVLELKIHLIKTQLLRRDSLEELTLYDEAIILCDKLVNETITTKHFNDHLKIINLGLESHKLNLMVINESISLEE